MKKLYLVVGASGSGKDYIVDKLCRELNMTRCISRTTRPKRGNDDKHIFVSNLQALEEIPRSVAYSDYNGYHYYVLSDDLKNIDFYIIDVKGVQSLKKYMETHDDLDDISIEVLYINAPAMIRYSNMKKRGDKFKDRLRRLKIDKTEFEGFKGDSNFRSSDELYDYFRMKNIFDEYKRRSDRIREFYNVYNEEKE